VVKHADITQEWNALRQALEAERLRVQQEIGGYPPPIPLCDAYFNFLLEQRALLTDELRRLEEAVAESAASDDPSAVLDAFVASLRTEVGPT
jgi:DNA-binding SARP family transcriptional activator